MPGHHAKSLFISQCNLGALIYVQSAPAVNRRGDFCAAAVPQTLQFARLDPTSLDETEATHRMAHGFDQGSIDNAAQTRRFAPPLLTLKGH
jgi:hypothetical protein